MISLIPIIASLLALITALILAIVVNRKPRGSKEMIKFADFIHKGAMAFLNIEYKYLAFFIVIIAIILYFVRGTQFCMAFIFGAALSALSGNLGMRIATTANSRTTEACKKDMNSGLKVALFSGSVMSLTVVGLGLLGTLLLYNIFADVNVLFGYGFGASTIALFARVGGGIYT